MNWAILNGIIKKDSTKDDLKTKKRNTCINFCMVFIVLVLFGLLVALFVNRNTRIDSLTTLELATFVYSLVSILLMYALNSIKLRSHKSFQYKIESHLRELFPHSSNENYARANLPVSNNIRT